MDPQRGDLAAAVEALATELQRLSGDRLQAASWEVATYFDVPVPSSSHLARTGSTSLFAENLSTLETVARDVLQDASRVSQEWNDLRPAEITEWMCLHFCWQLDTSLQAALALLSKYVPDQG